MKRLALVLRAATGFCWACLASGAVLAGVMTVPNSPGSPSLSGVWSDLWRTPDQQGQALLDAGKPAGAARRFHDPRRRAYADLEAGRYPEAAKLLEPFADAESEYNRGNALARMGQLQAALSAYDAALRQAPDDLDIRHNRDLVARALRQRHQPPQTASRNGKPGGRGAGRRAQQPQRQSAAGRQAGQGSQQAADNSQRPGAQGSQSATSRQRSSNASAQAGTLGASGTGSAGSRLGQSGDSVDSAAAQPKPGNAAATSQEAPGQAQRDAALAARLAREQQHQAGGGKAGSTPAASLAGTSRPATADSAPGRLGGGALTPRQKPASERQLALEQWLRQIPDDPAGLLRRKFLIEHMMRQQEMGP